MGIRAEDPSLTNCFKTSTAMEDALHRMDCCNEEHEQHEIKTIWAIPDTPKAVDGANYAK